MKKHHIIPALLITTIVIYSAIQIYTCNVPLCATNIKKPYNVLTYMLVHTGWAHLFINMLALWYCFIEMHTLKIHRLYVPLFFIFSALAGCITQVLGNTTVGASGGIYGLLACCALYSINAANTLAKQHPEDKQAQKDFNFIYGYWLFQLGISILFSIAYNKYIDNVCHIVAALAGALWGYLYFYIHNKTPK